MEINLNYIQLECFKLNNKKNNLCHKNIKKYFNDIFFKYDHSFINLLKIALKNEKFNTNIYLHCHLIKGYQKEKLEEIILKCHPKLKDDLDQIFENENEINYYQAKIFKSERLIFVIKNIDSNKQCFIPIIFDLKHCIYIHEDKNYDNNSNTLNTKWNLNLDEYKCIIKKLKYNIEKIKKQPT